MRDPFAAMTGALAVAVVIVLLTPDARAGQARTTTVKPYSPPRMADGHPNLQGIYDLATLTPLERPDGARAVLSDDEAAKLERDVAARKELGEQSIGGDRFAPPKGGDGSIGPAGGVGGYNTFWLDPGSSYTIVNGEKRTSIVVEPADGRVPPLIPEARQRALARQARPTLMSSSFPLTAGQV